eukprot:6179559-Pleurochrysis_carterae.AAC.1
MRPAAMLLLHAFGSLLIKMLLMHAYAALFMLLAQARAVHCSRFRSRLRVVAPGSALRRAAPFAYLDPRRRSRLCCHRL